MKNAVVFSIFLIVMFLTQPVCGDQAFTHFNSSKHGWFAHGEQVGEIIPAPGAEKSASCIVKLGKEEMRFSYSIEQVISQENFCVFVGQRQLAVVRFKPNAEIVFERKFPTTEETFDVSLVEKSLVGCGNEGSAWVWSLDGQTQWFMQDSSFAFKRFAVLVPKGMFFATNNYLISSSETGFRGLVQLNRFGSIQDVYSCQERIVVFGSSAIGIYQPMQGEKGLELRNIKLYQPIFDGAVSTCLLEQGNTRIYGVSFNGGLKSIYEVDMVRAQYRSVAVKRKIESVAYVFIAGKDFLDSTDLKAGPFLKGDELDKAPWRSLDLIK